MKRDTPLSAKARWSILVATVLLHPLLLVLLLPVLGEPCNFVSLLAPVAATLLFSWRSGLAVTVVTVIVSACVFDALTGMSTREGMPKAIISGSVIVAACFAAEKLRRYIEQRKTIEEELRRAKKMEAVGRLAGGVAHDINNTLNSIVASVFAHRQELSPYGRHFPDLDNITAACERGAQLTRNLLGFARKSDYKRESISMNEVIESVHALLTRTANKNVRIDARLSLDKPAVLGDRAQIETAVINLCINSLDAMTTGGTLTMTAGKEDDRVFLCVEDTGIGMARDIKEHVFEPFFTTKAAGKGTGLGLSMVYGVVQAMSGRISLDTAPGKGTSIKLFFPKATASPQSAAEVPRPTIGSLKSLSGLTVLLIDDEPLVLRSGVRLLRALGCQALSAASGCAGIEIVKERKGAVDLVIVDFIMPDMDGLAVIDELCKVSPAIPVILASGYSRDSERLEGVKERYKSVGFLAKPYCSEDLVNITTELLHMSNRDAASDCQSAVE